MAVTWSEGLLALAIEAYATSRFAAVTAAGWSLPATRFWVEDGTVRGIELRDGLSPFEDIADLDGPPPPVAWLIDYEVEVRTTALDGSQLVFDEERVEIVVAGRDGVRVRSASVVRLDGWPLLGGFEQVV